MANHDSRLFQATVVSAELLTPVMRRVVLSGPGLADFDTTGHPDEWLQLFIPPAAVGRPGPDPLSRWYSVRRWEPSTRRLTIDIVVHDDGAATGWAERAQPGDAITVSAPAGRFEPPADTAWILVAADQTALAAASRILEELPAGHRAWALLEAPGPAGVVPLEVGNDVDVRWVYHPHPSGLGSPLTAAVRQFVPPPGPGYIWMAGEASCSREIRRYVRHELGWKPARFDIVGYWRPDAERYQNRYRAAEQELGEIWDRGRADGKDTGAIADEIYAALESRGL
ncbi:MAG TPA: siderophore-interacting protein [Microlunatus sp.]|nr:siderophore-interacting protein [Microlunatus sp.]